MPKHGILQLGRRATAYYLYQLRRIYRQRYQQPAPLNIVRSDFHTINQHLPHGENEIIKLLSPYLDLFAANVTHLILPNITIHRFSLPTKIPLINPIDATLQQLQTDGVNTAWLLGSYHTMYADWLPKRFAAFAIQLYTPPKIACQQIEQLRLSVYHHSETEQQIAAYHSILQTLVKKRPVVIACTELSMVTPPIPQCYDMAEYQMNQAVRKNTNA